MDDGFSIPERDPGYRPGMSLVLNSLKQLQKGMVGLSPNDIVGIVQGLIGEKGGVDTADDYGDTVGAQVARHAVRFTAGRGCSGDPYQITLQNLRPGQAGALTDVQGHGVPCVVQNSAQQR